MKVYISYSTPDRSLVERVTKALAEEGIQYVCYWNGRTYDPSLLDQSDAAVFILPGMSWESPVIGLTHGMLGELVRCINAKKDIYIAYKNSAGRVGIYASEITDKLVIHGLIGTYGNIGLVKNIDPSMLSEPVDTTSIISEPFERFY